MPRQPARRETISAIAPGAPGRQGNRSLFGQLPVLVLFPAEERDHPDKRHTERIARNTLLTSACVSRTRASSAEKSGASPARAITRSRFSPEVSGLNLPVTHK